MYMNSSVTVQLTQHLPLFHSSSCASCHQNLLMQDLQGPATKAEGSKHEMLEDTTIEGHQQCCKVMSK